MSKLPRILTLKPNGCAMV